MYSYPENWNELGAMALLATPEFNQLANYLRRFTQELS